MSASAVIFYLLSAFILVTGVLAVTTRKIFRSAIWLLFSLAGIGGLYFWMGLEFIAAVQIVVYVGGIVVLIIFSIFLTQQTGKELTAPRRRRVLFSTLAVLLGFTLTCLLVTQHEFTDSAATPVFATPFGPAPIDSGIATIGSSLLSPSGYALPFEVVSILLLAAMIGCIVVALKTNKS